MPSRQKKKKSSKRKKVPDQSDTKKNSSSQIHLNIKQAPDQLQLGRMGRRGRVPPRRQRSRQRKRNSRLPALRSVRLVSKHVNIFTDITNRHWTYTFKMADIADRYTSYDQFKCLGLRITVRPYDSNQTAGLRVSLLLDGDGFGAFPDLKQSQLFEMLAETPGSKVHPTYRPVVLNWKPSGPEARRWFKAGDNFVIARLYFINNDANQADLGGIIELQATILARGVAHGGKALFNATPSGGEQQQHSDCFEMLQSPEDY